MYYENIISALEKKHNKPFYYLPHEKKRKGTVRKLYRDKYPNLVRLAKKFKKSKMKE